MDIYCQHCGEPWDLYHLTHDVPEECIQEGVLDRDYVTHWDRKLNRYVRSAYEKAGYEVGVSVGDLRRCPACEGHDRKGHAPLDTERALVLSTMADILGDDLDGLACEMEDCGLF